MSKIYQIRLKPIGSYYFGGEDSFSSRLPSSIELDDENAKNYFKKRQSYYAKSEKFPQQTQLLGMLRRTILMQSEKMHFFKNFITVHKNNKDKAEELVGLGSWRANDSLSLGKIEKISPIFLSFQSDDSSNPIVLLPAPKDIKWRLESVYGSKAFINSKKIDEAYRFFKGRFPIGAKDFTFDGFIDSGGTIHEAENKDKSKNIFLKEVRSHTQTLDYTDKDEEKYFKVQRYRLNKGYSFCFYLTVAYDLQLINDTVAIGGEESYFEMIVNEIKGNYKNDDEIFAQFQKPIIDKSANQTDKRLMLISDTFIDAKDDIFEYTKASIADKVILRTAQIAGGSFVKSAKTILLRRGSIFIPKDGNALKTIKGLIDKHSNYQIIGYNQYIEL